MSGRFRLIESYFNKTVKIVKKCFYLIFAVCFLGNRTFAVLFLLFWLIIGISVKKFKFSFDDSKGFYDH